MASIMVSKTIQNHSVFKKNRWNRSDPVSKTNQFSLEMNLCIIAKKKFLTSFTDKPTDHLQFLKPWYGRRSARPSYNNTTRTASPIKNNVAPQVTDLAHSFSSVLPFICH